MFLFYFNYSYLLLLAPPKGCFFNVRNDVIWQFWEASFLTEEQSESTADVLCATAY